jgi:hypothetical protein
LESEKCVPQLAIAKRRIQQPRSGGIGKPGT